MDKAKQKLRRKPTHMQEIAIGYIAVILVGAFLLSLPIASRNGEWTDFVDSLFTSTSATCVTGLVTLPTYAHWSVFGQVVILLLIQIGGVGFMTVVTFMSVFLGRRITLHERRRFMLSAGTGEVGGAVTLIYRILIGTLIFETAGAVVLAFRFVPEMGWGRGIYYAVFHSVSAFCNAGFDLMGFFDSSSLTRYAGDPIVNITVMALIVIGGLGFIVWSDILTARFRLKKCQLHTKLVLFVTVILLVVGTVCFFGFEYNNENIPLNMKERIFTAFFNSVTPRTAGFNTVDLASLTNASLLLMIILMVIGGAPGSTAGGIKVTTFAVLLMGSYSAARKNNETVIFNRGIGKDLLRQSTAIATIYFLLFGVSSTVISALHPEFSLTAVFFEVTSALSNVGMTLGMTPLLGDVSKCIIALLMYIGRVGILSLALVLAEKRENLPITHPTEDVLVG